MPKAKNQFRGGIAMVLVVVVMAAAAVMGFALLSSASSQAQASRNASSSFVADGLDRSGTNLALYYLMYPDKASSSLMTTSGSTVFYNPGTTVPAMNLANGASVSQVTVALSSRSSSAAQYTVDVTANSGSAGVTRTQRSNVQVLQRYVPQYAMAARDSFSLPMTYTTSSIAGAVRCDGGFGGLVSAASGPIYGTSGNPTPTYPQSACPKYTELNVAKSCNSGTYSYGTITYNCQTLPAGTLTSSSFTANSGNPYNIFYAPSDITLSGTITLNGTIVLANNRSLSIASSSVTITPKTSYPALIVGKDLIFNGNGRTLKVNGVCWLGGNLTGSSVLAGGTLNVNGSLMWGGNNPKIDTSKLLNSVFPSKLIVAWPSSAATLDSPTPDVLYVPELSDVDQTPKSVKILSTSVR